MSSKYLLTRRDTIFNYLKGVNKTEESAPYEGRVTRLDDARDWMNRHWEKHPPFGEEEHKEHRWLVDRISQEIVRAKLKQPFEPIWLSEAAMADLINDFFGYQETDEAEIEQCEEEIARLKTEVARLNTEVVLLTGTLASMKKEAQ